MPIWPSIFLLSSLILLLPAGRVGSNSIAAEEVLVVNSDPTDPAVPLDLSLTVRLFPEERLLEITVRVGKHPAYPAEIFFNKNVKVEIKLPVGLELEEGSLNWKGDLQGEEIKEFQAKVKAVKDTEGAVVASAIGDAPGGQIDADTEQFYVLVKGNTIRMSLESFVSQPFKPGRATPGR